MQKGLTCENRKRRMHTYQQPNNRTTENGKWKMQDYTTRFDNALSALSEDAQAVEILTAKYGFDVDTPMFFRAIARIAEERRVSIVTIAHLLVTNNL